MKPKYDILWKGVIEEVIEDLLLFVEPGIGKELDLAKGFGFLDKELAELYPQEGEPANTRVVDKLIRVYLADGSERWMLLHVEVQGNHEKDFGRRMFEYYTRLFSKYGRPIAAIAIITRRDGRPMPAGYESRCFWTLLRYDYKTLNIAEYNSVDLEASNNPFAAVILVAREVLLRVKGTDDDRDRELLRQKLLMVRLLKRKMAIFGKRKTAVILSFLNNYVAFKKPEINLNFMAETDKIFGKTNTVGYFEQLAEIKHQEGVEEGRERGREETVRILLANTEFSPDKIAKLAGVTLSVVEKVKQGLGAK